MGWQPCGNCAGSGCGPCSDTIDLVLPSATLNIAFGTPPAGCACDPFGGTITLSAVADFRYHPVYGSLTPANFCIYEGTLTVTSGSGIDDCYSPPNEFEEYGFCLYWLKAAASGSAIGDQAELLIYDIINGMTTLYGNRISIVLADRLNNVTYDVTDWAEDVAVNGSCDQNLIMTYVDPNGLGQPEPITTNVSGWQCEIQDQDQFEVIP